MAKKPALWVGGAMIALGIILFVGTLTRVNIWPYVWPSLIILLGVLLLVRPRMLGSQTNVDFHLLGDVHLGSDWPVHSQEIWNVIGDTVLDLSRADFPEGETNLRVMGFVGDVKVRLPEAVGVKLNATGLVVDGNLFGMKDTGIFTPVQLESDNYASAAQRVNIETGYFIHEINLERSL